MRRADRLFFISCRQFLSVPTWLTRSDRRGWSLVSAGRQLSQPLVNVGSIGNDYLD
jgi:hypothetical protein